MKSNRVLLLLVFASAVSAFAQSYKTELDLGVAAYKDNHYEDAIQHFRRATELDPGQPLARMYLASVYTSEYIPGVDTPDNVQFAEQAIEPYEAVLNSDAPRDSRVNAAKGIAYLLLNMKKFDEAKRYDQMISGLDPNDPEPYYYIGVIDWTICYKPRMEGRAKLGMKPDDHLDAKKPAQKSLCDELNAKNRSVVEEGIDSLSRAIQLRPDYDDAMAYLNLMFRERADLECDDPAARQQDLKRAEHWVDRTIAVKKVKAEREAPSKSEQDK